MTYNFINQDVASLENLRDAVYEEIKRRFHLRILTWPRPKIIRDEEGRCLTVESIKLYRQQTDCRLSEAKWVVEYYMNE